jgi:hypothetical protein
VDLIELAHVMTVMEGAVFSLLVTCSAYSSMLKMEAVCSFGTSVNFYQAIRRHVPEDDSAEGNEASGSIEGAESLDQLLHSFGCPAQVGPSRTLKCGALTHVANVFVCVRLPLAYLTL